MRIAVDLDGVCYEWSRTAMYMLRRFRGCSFAHEESQTWDYIHDNVPKADWKWLWDDGIKNGLFRYGHMVKDARIGLEALYAAGHKLIIVSHRPETATTDTLDWVSLYFKNIPLAGFSLLSNNEPKTEIPWDLLIDDKPENIDNAIGHARQAWLFDQPWNQHYDSIIRVYGWQGVVNSIEFM